MAESAALLVYNFVNAVLLKAGTAAIMASNIAHVAAITAKVALIVTANAVISNQNKPEPQGQLINMTINPNEPRRLIVGKRMTGGVLADWMIKGDKNQYLYTVTYLSEGPVNRITKVFAGGREVHSVPLVHGVRTPIPSFNISGGDRLFLTFYDGRPSQVSDPRLIAEFPGEWSANKRGVGVAYVVAEIWYDSDIQQIPPSLSYEVEGACFYDRRFDTTAGGAGSQRFNDPATWVYTTNPAVMLDHYMLSRRYEAVKVFGIGLSADQVPFDEFVALANLCDENVAIKVGGTQKRYEANGYLFADRSFKDTIKDLCRAMGARPADFGGRIGILDNQPKSPVMELTEQDVLEGTKDQYRPKSSYSELHNGVTGTFINPSQNYQPTDFPRITNAVWEEQDGGQQKLDVIDFEMEVSQERAERLATNYIQAKRRQARLSGTYKLRAIQLEQGDWFVRSGGRFGAGKTFEVIDRVLNPMTMSVTIAAFEVDPSDSAWNEADAADEVVYPGPGVGITALPLPDMTLTSFSFSVGPLTFPSFRFVNNDAASVIPYGVNIEYGIRAAGTPGPPDAEVFTHYMQGGVAQSTVYGLFPNVDYVVRYQNVFGSRRSAWTDWLVYNTSPEYLSGEAGSIDWSNVLGVGKPFDFADVTGGNIAAGITGQGSFATLSSISTSVANLNNLLRRSAGGIFSGDLAADITALNVAAAISGQGAFATLSSITAAMANANNLLRRAAGGLYTGALNADVTALGIAAGFAGQGALATLAQVNTPQIVGGAVSNVSGVYTPGVISCAVNNWTTIQTLNLTSAGGAIILSTAFSAYHYINGINAWQDVRILRDGNVIYQSNRFNLMYSGGFGGNAYQPFSATIQDTPAAGFRSFVTQVFSTADTLLPECNFRSMVGTELKR